MKLHFVASIANEQHNGEWKLVYINEGEVAGRGWGIFKRGLEASLPKFQDVWVQSLRFEGGTHDHLPADVRAVFPSGVITDNIIGMASRPALEEIDGKWAMTGWFRPATEKMQNLLAMASATGKLGDFGLSINGDVLDNAHIAPHTLASGQTIDEILEIDELYSTDMVTYPGRGGGFSDVLASAGVIEIPRKHQQRGTPMNITKALKALLDRKGIAYQDAPAPLGILASVGIVAAEGNEPEGMSANDKTLLESIHAALTAGLDQVAATIMDAVKGGSDKPGEGEEIQAATPKEDEPAEDDEEEKKKKDVQASAALQRVERLETRLLVKDLLASEETLPGPVKLILASRFDNAIASREEIAAAIAETKKVISLTSDTGHGKHYTGGVQVMASANDKIQQACDQLFGVVPSRFQASLKKLEDCQGITPQESQERYGVQASSKIASRYDMPRIGLRDLHIELTGDTDISFDFASPRGRKRLLEASTTKQTTLPYAVGVSINRRLVQDWMEQEIPWRSLCNIKSDGLKDFREQEIIRPAAAWDEWADVAEGDAYQELAVPTEVKETYTPGKQGNLLPITREMVMRDDVRLVDRLLRLFRLAGQNGFNKAFFKRFVNYSSAAVNDGTMGDDTEVYHADHNNLLSAAITHTNMIALKALIRAQKAESSDIWMQLVGKFVVVPLSLEDQNLVYIVSERVPDDVINNANILRIKEEDCIVIDDALLQSSSYIYMSVDPTVYPTMEVGFINNQQVPEIFVQNDPTMGNAFLKDIYTWKGRIEYGIGWEDWKGVARLGV